MLLNKKHAWPQTPYRLYKYALHTHSHLLACYPIGTRHWHSTAWITANAHQHRSIITSGLSTDGITAARQLMKCNSTFHQDSNIWHQKRIATRTAATYRPAQAFTRP